MMEHEEITAGPSSNYLDAIVRQDLPALGTRPVCTRFPPEPNGYLHIGNAFAIHISYSLAHKHGGRFHLRFDDTNPLREDSEYVNAILRDMKWLGFDPGEHIYYGSDYSERLYAYALQLIGQGDAYVCDLSPEEVNEYRGNLTEAGRNSPCRNRTPEENRALFEAMRRGEYPNGAKVLRAKIDMASPNLNLRDPVLYRIIHAPHYRTGDDWCIYPMYDFAHPLQDAIEGITHSLCSIEFKDHRPLYDWVLQRLGIDPAPVQREFGRLKLRGSVTSKRYLRQLVMDGYVDGWDDPRLPTVSGLRRRGFTPSGIKRFLDGIGVARDTSVMDLKLLEHVQRDELKTAVPCVMAVLDPLKVTIVNYPEDGEELLPIPVNPENPELGSRMVPFGREIVIEREDFMEEPVKGFQRLAPGQEVRLKGAYFIALESVVKDPVTDEIVELRCTYDPRTKSGSGFAERKVKGTIHWVSAKHALRAEVRLVSDLLLEEEASDEAGSTGERSWLERLNPDSLVIKRECYLEPELREAGPETRYQFMRHGYFIADPKLSEPRHPVFSRIVSLKDTWRRTSKL